MICREVLVALRVEDAFQLPIALFVVVMACIAEVTISTERRG